MELLLLKPKVVRDAILKYYDEYTANTHRGDYKLSATVDRLYERLEKKLKPLLMLKNLLKLFFTDGTTNGMNIIVSGF